MVRAWYMDDSNEDQRLPHQTQPIQTVSFEQLQKIGVYYWNVPVDDLKDNSSPALEKIRQERNYKNMDLITVHPDKLPNYEQKVKNFYEEHLHVDEEIRYCLDGKGYFDVRDDEDRWIRIEVTKDDLITLPAGIYHRFTPDTNNYLRAMRLFQEEPVWTPYNRSDQTDQMNIRQKFLEQRRSRLMEESPNGIGYILDDRAKAIANYPHMRQVGEWLYVSGISSRRPDNTHVGAVKQDDGKWILNIEEQTRAVIENIRVILKAAGADLENVVDLTCFLVDMKDYQGYNKVYNEYFNAHTGPSRTTVAVHQLPHPNILIEIKVVAVLSKRRKLN